MKKNTPTPMSPRLATDSPMIEPPKKAEDKARAISGLYLLAPSAVRTLAFVAPFMPIKPASMEDMPPQIYAIAV